MRRGGLRSAALAGVLVLPCGLLLGALTALVALPCALVEGWLARIMYVGLYRMHQAALYGWPRTLMLLAAGRFSKLVRPRLKLH